MLMARRSASNYPTHPGKAVSIGWPSQQTRVAHLQDVAHQLCRHRIQRLAECIEILQISLVEGVPDDLDVQLVQIMCG